MLTDRDPDVRGSAARSLMYYGDADPNKFVGMFSDPEPATRWLVATAAIDSGIGAPNVRGLLSDPNSRVRSQVACSLIYRGDSAEYFLPLLRDSSKQVRRSVAVSFIGSGRDPETTRFLLDDPEESVRAGVAEALLDLGHGPYSKCLTVLARAGTHRLAKHIDAAGPETIAELTNTFLQWVEEGDPKQQSTGRWCIGWLPEIPPSARDRIARLIRTCPESDAFRIDRLVGHLNREQRIETLRHLLGRRERKVRAEALYSVVALNLKELLPECRKLLQDPDTVSRLRAAEAVAMFDSTDTTCVDVMCASLNTDDSALLYAFLQAFEVAGPRVFDVRETLWKIREEDGAYYRVAGLIEQCGEKCPLVLKEWLDRLDVDHQVLFELFDLIESAKSPQRFKSLERDILRIATGTRNSELSMAALRALGAVGVSDLRSLQTFPRSAEVLACLGTTTGDAKPSALKTLQPAMMKGPFHHRVVAAMAWAKLQGDRETVGTAVAMLVTDEIFDRYTFEDKIVDLIRTNQLGERIRPSVQKRLDQHTFEDIPVDLCEACGIDLLSVLVEGIAGEDVAWASVCTAAVAEHRITNPWLLAPLMDFAKARELAERDVLKAGGELSSGQECALRSIARMKPDASIVPMMMAYIRAEAEVGVCADVLSAVGPEARKAVPVLMRVKLGDFNYEAVPAARAVAIIEPGPIGLLGLRRCLRFFRFEKPNMFYPDMGLLIDTVVELGDRAHVFRKDLEAVAIADFISPQRRCLAAYALARLYPDEPQWREVLVRLSQRITETDSASHATSRLEKLDASRDAAK